LEKYHRPQLDDSFKAIFKKEIKESEEGAAELRKRLAKYWCQTAGGVMTYVACERCFRHDPELANLMEHIPDGWKEMSKEEWIAKELMETCVVM
jgi:hypothetical protein